MQTENKVAQHEHLLTKLNEIKRLVDECIVTLPSGNPSGFIPPNKASRMVSTTKLDFKINNRAFIKKYGKDLSGPKKFVLLIAYLAQGEIHKEVAVHDIEKQWNAMDGLLGMEYNGKYPTAAKDNGWVDSKKRGNYFLAESWQEIFK